MKGERAVKMKSEGKRTPIHVHRDKPGVPSSATSTARSRRCHAATAIAVSSAEARGCEENSLRAAAAAFCTTTFRFIMCLREESIMLWC